MSVLHWLNTELWGPMWPNIFAPSAITLAAILLAHVRTRMHIRTTHQATTAAVRDQLAEHQKQVTAQLAAHCADIKQHVNAVVADAQASAGAGSNPPAATTTTTGRRRR